MNINTAGCDISGHQHPDRTRLEIGQSFSASPLGFISVNCRGRNTVGFELRSQSISSVLGPREHQYLLPIILAYLL